MRVAWATARRAPVPWRRPFSSQAWLVVHASHSPFLVPQAISALLSEDSSAASLDQPQVATALLAAAKRAKRLDLANRVLVTARERGLTWDLPLVNAAISTYASTGRIDEARSLLDLMTEGELPAPDVRSFSPIMSSLANDGNVEQVRDLIAEMERCGLEPDTVVYNTLLHCLVRAKAPASVLLATFQRMRDDCAPDSYTYTTLMKGLADAGDEAEVERLFAELQYKQEELGNLPLHAWSALLQVYARRGAVEKAEVIWREMAARGVRQVKAHYGCMFWCIERSGHSGGEQGASQRSLDFLRETLDGNSDKLDLRMLRSVVRAAVASNDVDGILWVAQVADSLGLDADGQKLVQSAAALHRKRGELGERRELLRRWATVT